MGGLYPPPPHPGPVPSGYKFLKETNLLDTKIQWMKLDIISKNSGEILTSYIEQLKLSFLIDQVRKFLIGVENVGVEKSFLIYFPNRVLTSMFAS